MKTINMLIIYSIIIVCIIAIVLIPTLSKTLNSTTQMLSLKNEITNDEESFQDYKYVLTTKLGFSQNPLLGLEKERIFKDALGWSDYKGGDRCTKLSNIILNDCVGMWEKRTDCKILNDEFESCFTEE